MQVKQKFPLYGELALMIAIILVVAFVSKNTSAKSKSPRPITPIISGNAAIEP